MIKNSDEQNAGKHYFERDISNYFSFSKVTEHLKGFFSKNGCKRQIPALM